MQILLNRTEIDGFIFVIMREKPIMVEFYRNGYINHVNLKKFTVNANYKPVEADYYFEFYRNFITNHKNDETWK